MMATLAAAARWLKHWPWRALLLYGTAFYIAMMFLFWLVVFDVVRNQWLVIFIDADQTFAQNIGYLVVMWACVEMAPTGLEGTTLALATTVGNAGQSLGTYVTMFYNGFFDLSREAIASDTAYVRRQYIYNALAVIATQCAYLLALRLMPDQKRDAREKFTQYLRSMPTAIASAVMITFAVVWGMGT